MKKKTNNRNQKEQWSRLRNMDKYCIIVPDSFLVNGLKKKPQLHSGHRSPTPVNAPRGRCRSDRCVKRKALLPSLSISSTASLTRRMTVTMEAGNKREKRARLTTVLQVWISRVFMWLGWTRVRRWGAQHVTTLQSTLPVCVCMHMGVCHPIKQSTVPSTASPVIGHGLKNQPGFFFFSSSLKKRTPPRTHSFVWLTSNLLANERSMVWSYPRKKPESESKEGLTALIYLGKSNRIAKKMNKPVLFFSHSL